jgi:integration host factor subunit beta
MGQSSITKSEMIDMLAAEQPQLAYRDVELAVKGLLERMADALADGERIEVRGFGSFSLHYRPTRVGRNPKTGDTVIVPDKHVPHFKPGKELRERVDGANHHVNLHGEKSERR